MVLICICRDIFCICVGVYCVGIVYDDTIVDSKYSFGSIFVELSLEDVVFAAASRASSARKKYKRINTRVSKYTMASMGIPWYMGCHDRSFF